MLALKKFASENFDRYTGTFGPQNIKARVAHILVKHRDSRRPSSWREVCDSPLLWITCCSGLIVADWTY